MIDISTYLDRITSEHKDKPKFMALVEARLKPFVDIFELLEEIDRAFDIDTAEGNQLDIIGKFVGVERLLNFQPQFTNAVLPDSYYRVLLNARISLNNWNGTVEGIKEIWDETFPDYEVQVIDNQNMTMETRIVGVNSLFESELIQHGYITPKPMGVNVKYSIVMPMHVESFLYTEGVLPCNQQYRNIPTSIVPIDGVIPLDFVQTRL